MNPRLIDPDSPAPGMVPADVWADAVAWDPATPPLSVWSNTTVLPDKRTSPQSRADAPADNPCMSCHPALKKARHSDRETQAQLEVVTIDGHVLRLDPEGSFSPKTTLPVLVSETPVAPDPRREPGGADANWGLRQNFSLRWILTISLGISTVLIVALMLLPLINQSNAVPHDKQSTGLVLDRETRSAGSASWNELLTRQPDAQQVFRAFARARVADDLLPLLRHPDIVAPLIRAQFRPVLLSHDWTPPADSTWIVVDNYTCPYAILEGSLPDFSTFSAYLVLSHQHLLLDWKATTGYGTATFDELQQQQGDPREIRAWIFPADFYTDRFPEADFQSYQLTAPDYRKTLWTYTRRGDATDVALAQLFPSGSIPANPTAPEKVTLRLQPAPQGSLPNQWRIQEMLHKDWITL
jgi:hypothetical protein